MLSVMPAARKLVGSWTRPMLSVPPLTAPGFWVGSELDELEDEPAVELLLDPHAARALITPMPTTPSSRRLREWSSMHTSWVVLAASCGLVHARHGRISGARLAQGPRAVLRRTAFCEGGQAGASPRRMIFASAALN